MFFKILKFWFTGKDNESYEIMRALTALSVVVMLIYIGCHLLFNGQFDPLSAAGGLGALLFGGGAGAAIKDNAGVPKVTVQGDIQQADVAGDMNVAGDNK